MRNIDQLKLWPLIETYADAYAGMVTAQNSGWGRTVINAENRYAQVRADTLKALGMTEKDLP